MPTLVLVRHAKSSWDDPTLADADRPLSPRGVKALGRMAAHVSSSVPPPDLVLCSPARRTRETLEGLRPALPPGTRIEIEDDIYGAGTDGLRRLVTALDDATACAMLVGHNPGLQDLALTLVGNGDADLRRRLWAKFPTGAIATLTVPGGWPEAAASTARLDDLFTPRPPRV